MKTEQGETGTWGASGREANTGVPKKIAVSSKPRKGGRKRRVTRLGTNSKNENVKEYDQNSYPRATEKSRKARLLERSGCVRKRK